YLVETADAMDLAMARLFVALRTWALWPFALAICTGAGLWALHRVTSTTTHLDTNKLPEIDRIWMGIWVAASFVTLVVTYVVIGLVWRRRRADVSVAEVASTLNGRLFPLLALPFVPALATPNIEKDWPKLALFYVFVVGAIVTRGAYAWVRPSAARASEDERPRPPREWPRYVAFAALMALFMGYGAFFARLSITNHHALNTRTTDLGYYDNIFYQSAHGHPLGCTYIKAGYHGSAHFDPILVLLSPLYMLSPRAEFLLVLQAFWLAVGVFPVYLIAKAKLGRRLPAVVLAALYAIYPALQGANMYEFHSLTLASPILLFLLYFLETKNLTFYWPTFALALLTREDISLLLCFIGAYAILSDRAKLGRVGWITIGASIVYFVTVKRLFMTSSDIFMTGKDSYSFAYYYDDLIPNRTGLGGMLLTLVTNPVFVLKTIFAEAKVQYFLLLFLPLGFLPLFDRPGRVMLIYGFVFTLLASRTAVYSVHFQYSSVILPIAFALTPRALRRIEDAPAGVFGLDGARLSRALVAGIVATSLLVSWKFGGIVDNQSFKGGFSRVARRLNDAQRETYAWIHDTAELIPKNASVGVTNKIGPHVSNRMRAYFYPERTHTDYVFIDEAELKGNDLEKHQRAVKQGQLVQIARKGRLALFKRNQAKTPPPAPTATGSAQAPGPDTDPQRDREKEAE
ncbi:MAG TPA: DUF2079 domain-containing protein, partial [Minicystis sp.]|nr:DUF2079 domain-containing protein [Minicystis sp.]